MSNYLTASNITTVTGIYQNVFDTFAIDKIIVHKEPKKSFVSTNYNQRTLQGYSVPSIEENVQYTYESGVFPAIVKPNKVQKSSNLTALNTIILEGETLIKVSETAGLYIKNSKTVNIEISGRNDVYNVIADEAIENFQGLKFYLFGLNKVN